MRSVFRCRNLVKSKCLSSTRYKQVFIIFRLKSEIKYKKLSTPSYLYTYLYICLSLFLAHAFSFFYSFHYAIFHSFSFPIPFVTSLLLNLLCGSKFFFFFFCLKACCMLFTPLYSPLKLYFLSRL